MAGFMLFLSPLLIIWFPMEHVILGLCLIATFAALQEGNYIRTGKMEVVADADNNEKAIRGL